MFSSANNSTKEKRYTDRLVAKGGTWWKQLLDVQRPYRWNLRRLHPGFTLDLGCGIGRNLVYLNGVGVDHNDASVAFCRDKGLTAFNPDEFLQSRFNMPGMFDSILLAHVAEHMTAAEAATLLKTYLPLLKRGGMVIIITPQEAGYRSDSTHEQYMTFEVVGKICARLELKVVRMYSFPFPRIFGHWFKYNEFVTVAQKG